MKLLRKLKEFLFNSKLQKASKNFKSKESLFELNFDDENWIYTSNGNSFYSFHNTESNLKGGLQFSLIWNKPICNSIGSFDNLKHSLERKENVSNIITSLNNSEAIYFPNKYPDSNMDFHCWYLFPKNIYIQITFYDFQGGTGGY